MQLSKYIRLMREKSFLGILKGIKNVLLHEAKKFLLYIQPVCKKEISGKENSIGNENVVVSLTSFPERIEVVYYCIKSILNQSFKPDAVILWLAEEQFPNKERELPKKLLGLCRHGLTIAWCNDIKSYKKIIPTLKSFPNSIIITTDDDVYYQSKWLEGLIHAYQKDPLNIYCYRAAKIQYIESFKRIDPGKNIVYKKPTYLHQQTGVGGVLYPVGALHKDVLDEQIFMDIASTNDDLWLWFMGIKNGYRVSVLNDNNFELFYIGKSQEVALTKINDQGEMMYFKQLQLLLERYPEVREALCLEQAMIQEENEN